MSVSILEAESIRFSFGQRVILSDISLRCSTGSVVGLLGRNGCGKSTLLQIIYGSLHVEEAIIRIQGKPAKPAYLPPWHCGFLPQRPYLPRNISVNKACTLFGINVTDVANQIPTLRGEQNKLIAELSYGTIRMLEIYLTVKKRGAFTFLDEPFNGLSPIARQEVQQWIGEELPNKGFIISDHDYKSVMECCSELHLLREGKNWLCRNEDELRKGGYLPPA